ncbi:hypothetical protein JG687_00006014 [Phytophthora cactorum]|uniref:Uncharacterized protein n=1 Tax=Phytophthora cactorum TaxID=29920 RepID=A0A8T1UJJ3_9STRA|nr:hypothetical protein JG687_00006014 [Phytophthora cactorum]
MLPVAADRQSGMATNRLLRTDDAADENDEERGFSGLSRLIKPLTQRKAESTFKLYKLEDKKGTLFASNEVVEWGQHLTKFDKKNAGAAMLKALLKRYDDTELARMIESAKSSAKANSQQSCRRRSLRSGRKPISSRKALKNANRWSKHNEDIVTAYESFIQTKRAVK